MAENTHIAGGETFTVNTDGDGHTRLIDKQGYHLGEGPSHAAAIADNARLRDIEAAVAITTAPSVDELRSVRSALASLADHVPTPDGAAKAAWAAANAFPSASVSIDRAGLAMPSRAVTKTPPLTPRPKRSR